MTHAKIFAEFKISKNNKAILLTKDGRNALFHTDDVQPCNIRSAHGEGYVWLKNHKAIATAAKKGLFR